MSVLENLLDDYGVDYITTGANSSADYVNINCICGECVGDEKYKLGIHRSLSRSFCWACGYVNLYNVVKELGIPWSEFKVLQEEPMPEWGLEQTNSKYKTEMPAESTGITLPGDALQDVHKEYLISRGFDPAWLEKEYGVKGTIKYFDDFSLSYRIIFPVTFNNIPISFIARTYIASEKKRRYRAASPSEECLYHKAMVFNCDKATGKRMILVEGLLDCLKLVQASGRYDITASYGTAVKPEQLSFIRDRWEEVIVLFDPEIKAQAHAKEIVSYLQSYGIRAKSVSLKGYEDPGALDLPTAKKLVNYLLDLEWRD